MWVDVLREEYGRFFQIIDHDAKMEIKIHSDGRVTRHNGPVFGVCGNDPYMGWEDLERETGFTRERIEEEFKLGVKEF